MILKSYVSEDKKEVMWQKVMKAMDSLIWDLRSLSYTYMTGKI